MARIGCHILLLALAQVPAVVRAEYITRIWLTHPVSDASMLMVNWETDARGPSRVDFGPSPALGGRVQSDSAGPRHQIAIPFPDSGVLHYRVATGNQCSAIHRVKSYGGEELRVAVAANWQERPALEGLLADDPHLLLSCGDLVSDLLRQHEADDGTIAQPFSELIGAYPSLFARTPFLAVPGNHDRQVALRLLQPSAVPAYDLEASAFRAFFPQPAPGNIWHLDLPAFDLRLIGLDLSHTRDGGTTWQSCPDFGPDSDQLNWFRRVMGASTQRHVVTVYNEWHHLLAKLADGAWMAQIRRGSAAVSGFGLFAERADFDGLPCFNTALKTGPIYGNGGRTRFYQKAPGYLMLTFPRGGGPMKAEFKGLNGNTMNQSSWPGRRSAGSLGGK